MHDSSVAAFEAGLKDNDDNISPSQIYVYAALQSGVPFANGAPNLSTDLPCMIELSKTRGVPIAGKDFKTGQTLMKTLLAPGLKARMLGLRGWYSTNILGNRDGEVLDDPENFKTKEESKLGVLDKILQPEVYPDLYGNIDHVVRINYYPPRGDNKEGWDAIDIFGWMGYPMQIKIDFLCRDSILAAPIVLDLALFMDLAHRAGESGVQEWLSFYLKAPQSDGDHEAEQDLFIQQTKHHEIGCGGSYSNARSPIRISKDTNSYGSTGLGHPRGGCRSPRSRHRASRGRPAIRAEPASLVPASRWP